MQAGKRDRTITVERRGPDVDDGYTTCPGEWVPVGTRKAQVIRSRAREVFENQGREAEIPLTFLLASDTLTRSISEVDRIVFEGRAFDIVSTLEIGRREGVEIVGVAGDESPL